MPIDDLLFIHPLLGMNEAWAGYLVESAGTVPDAQALLHLGQHPGVREFDQRQPWLLPAVPDLAKKCSIANTAYLFTSPLGDAERALEAELRQARHKVGLRVNPGEKLPMTGTWDAVLISASHGRTLPPYTLIGLASRTQVVVTDVHSRADYIWGQSNAWSLSSAEFLLARNSNGSRADMTRIKLLEMLALIAQDADTGSIEEIFRQEPKLSYSLLRLVNSAAIAPRSPITSFAQAINLLGRRQLQRWLQLLVYADPNNGHHPNPLLQKAAARGRLMELLAPSLVPQPVVDNLEDAAFMIGAFSLLDVLLNMSMSEILQQLPLARPVHTALAEQAGPLGKLLEAISSADSRDLKAAANSLQQTAVPAAAFLDAQLTAYSWAARIHPAP
ncbi:MAG: HDOD domain-containing protein [Azonexus sp.]